ncbi:MAG: Npt1/Npt2 family nucleotide transporter [Terriglobia bacterium]
MNRLRRMCNLERGEEAPAFLLFSYLTLALTSYTIIRAVRDGIFLHKFSAMTLPYVYIGIAIATGFIAAAYIHISSRVRQVGLLSGTLFFFTANLVVLWLLVRAQWTPAPWIFYIWTSIFGIIVTTQAWTVANSVLDLRQAKRIFPLVSSGGILGGALGGLIAAWLVKSVGTDNLILLPIPLLLLSVVVVQILIRRYSLPSRTDQAGTSKGARGISFLAVARKIATSPYLKLIVVLLALSAIVTQNIDFQFKGIVQSVFHSKDHITAFVASFSAYLALGAFLVQMIAGSRIIDKFGIRVTVFLLPVAILLGTATLLAFPLALWAASVLKGSDYTLRYSLDRATTELLYVPVPQTTKTQVKATIDMIVQRFADGLGGLMLLAVTRVLYKGHAGVGVFNLLLLFMWLWVAWRIRNEYRKEVAKIFIIGPEPLPAPIVPVVFSEAASVATLRSMLESRDEELVLSAMEMAVALRRPKWITRELITHPSPRVRAKALELAPLGDEELLECVKHDSDSSVRIGAILRVARETGGVGRPGRGLGQFLESPDLRVRLAALVGSARVHDRLPPGTIRKALDRIAAELQPDLPAWVEVAEALGDIPHVEAVDLHLRLLQHPDPAVKKTAIRSAGRAGHRELVSFLIPLLSDARWSPEVRLCLREYGTRIIGTLADRLRDPAEDIHVRRSIPLVLAYYPQQESVDVLLDGLFDYDGLLRYRTIRSLGKLRMLDPNLQFDREKVGLRLREESENTIWHRQALAVLYPKGGSNDLLEKLLRDKISRGKDRVFRLLALLLPPTTAISALLVMAEDDRVKRAAVAEFLDDVLPGSLRDMVLPVIEPKINVRRPSGSVEQILEACLRSPDQVLRECAAEAAARNHWPVSAGAKALAARRGEGSCER